MSNGILGPDVISGSETPMEIVPLTWWQTILAGVFLGLFNAFYKYKWRVKKKFCNETDKEITILIADNPWEAPEKGESHYKKKLYPGSTYDEVMRKAKAAGRTITLGPKGSSTDCKELEYIYPFKLNGIYVDTFRVSPTGVSEDKPLKGASWAGRSEPVVAPMGSSDQPVSIGVAIPLPYPMSVEVATKEAIEVVIDRIEGLPEEFEFLGSFPALKSPHLLEPGDRQSEAIIYIRQDTTMKAEIATVTAYQRIVSPEPVAHWTERAVTFWITR